MVIREEINGPVFDAYTDPERIHLIFFCPRCLIFHWHGCVSHEDPSRGDGGRCAHCRDRGTPGAMDWYYIRWNGEVLTDELQKEIEARYKPLRKIREEIERDLARLQRRRQKAAQGGW